jgi:hypothetical protein
MLHHEMWGDEIHSWNIAKASVSYGELISNTRYEGHPPVWYTILWIISKCTHSLVYIQIVHIVIASLVVYLVLFQSPIPLLTKLMLPFGYYFLFEYAVLSRNYAIGVLWAFCICIVLHKPFSYKYLLYYVLLLLLSNTHLIASLLAASLHLYCLLQLKERKVGYAIWLLHAMVGFFVLLPSVYFIFPPSDSQLDIAFWMSRFNTTTFANLIYTPIRSFLPIPAWWKYNFWNSAFLIELQHHYKAIFFLIAVLTLSILALVYWVLHKNTKSTILFFTNLLLSTGIGIIVPLVSARYSGYVFIAFVVALWLYGYEKGFSKRSNIIVRALLSIQIIAGVFIMVKDIKLPFSNEYRIPELLSTIQEEGTITTDYWGLNGLSAFTDQPYYCLDYQKKMSFLLWQKDDVLVKDYHEIVKTRYINGVKYVFEHNGKDFFYMLTINDPQTLHRYDTLLHKQYKVQLLKGTEGSIVGMGNVFLYKISKQ